MIACANEQMEIVQIILSAVHLIKGPSELKLMANLEHWNFAGETCFHIACKVRNSDKHKSSSAR